MAENDQAQGEDRGTNPAALGESPRRWGSSFLKGNVRFLHPARRDYWF